MKLEDLREYTSFLGPSDLGCTQRECKTNDNSIDQHRRMFESQISGAAEVKLPRWENVHARRVAWSYEMEGHAKMCSEKCCDLAEKKIAIVQSFNPLLR